MEITIYIIYCSLKSSFPISRSENISSVACPCPFHHILPCTRYCYQCYHASFLMIPLSRSTHYPQYGILLPQEWLLIMPPHHCALAVFLIGKQSPFACTKCFPLSPTNTPNPYSITQWIFIYNRVRSGTHHQCRTSYVSCIALTSYPIR